MQLSFSPLRVEPELICCNACISACEKCRQWQAALWLLGDMARSGISANSVSYSACISACQKGERWLEALGLLKAKDCLKGIGGRGCCVC